MDALLVTFSPWVLLASCHNSWSKCCIMCSILADRRWTERRREKRPGSRKAWVLKRMAWMRVQDEFKCAAAIIKLLQFLTWLNAFWIIYLPFRYILFWIVVFLVPFFFFMSSFYHYHRSLLLGSCFWVIINMSITFFIGRDANNDDNKEKTRQEEFMIWHEDYKFIFMMVACYLHWGVTWEESS